MTRIPAAVGTGWLREVGPYLERLATECISTVAAEAYEVVEEDDMR